MVIIVTGGAGFIGGNFIEQLFRINPSCTIICLDKMTYAGNPNVIAPLLKRKNFAFVKGDICSRKTVFSLFESTQPDYVVHFAAESHVDRSITDPTVFLQTNIIGTSILLDACIKYRVKRFHFVSTDEVYGDLPLDKSVPGFGEDSPMRPNSPYSSSKAAADMLVQTYHRTYGLDVTISRCTNNYGPYQHTEKLIPKMIENALSGQKLPIYGTGLNVRDWIHVNDHCEAIIQILFYGQPGAAYNVSGNNQLSNLELVHKICEIVGAPLELITFVEDRKGHDLRYALNATKITRELGWAPKVSFEPGLRNTVQWYAEHPNWWKTFNQEGLT